jgi:hypothetical protein
MLFRSAVRRKWPGQQQLIRTRPDPVQFARPATQKRRYTPPALAKLWGVKPDKVIGFIRRGELQAINIGTNPNGRPRFLISEEAIAAFEARRAVVPQVKVTRARRKHRDPRVIEFF